MREEIQVTIDANLIEGFKIGCAVCAVPYIGLGVLIGYFAKEWLKEPKQMGDGHER